MMEESGKKKDASVEDSCMFSLPPDFGALLVELNKLGMIRPKAKATREAIIQNEHNRPAFVG